ncbi:MAG: hypothetical protein KAW16_00730 [candidate division Zixibacteria bacterium]|nr:hypothetical protein [candidate division Zixibacteria bacterium]
MGKNSALDELFKEWLKFYQSKGIPTKGFSRDGVVDEDRFEKARRRILFILRETNDFPESNEFRGDLRTFLSQTLKWQLWHAVGRWACGILNDFPDYRECDDRQKIHNAIRQIAIINLKKITGGSWSDLDEINETAHRDKEFIKKEVDIIDPQVIVTCGTWSHLVWLFDLENLPMEDKPPFSYTKNRLYLSTRHPVRANNRETYDELKKLWDRAKKHEQK